MEIDLNYVELGRRIRDYRQKAKMTQEQLAERIDMATSNISHIERLHRKGKENHPQHYRGYNKNLA